MPKINTHAPSEQLTVDEYIAKQFKPGPNGETPDFAGVAVDFEIRAEAALFEGDSDLFEVWKGATHEARAREIAS